MASNFDEVMGKESDAELIKILTEQRSDYQAQAIEAAEREFAKRNLSQEQINLAKDEVIQKRQTVEAKSQEPLSGSWKALLFLLPGLSLLLVAAFALISHAEGYNQRRNDILKWTFYGLCFWGTIIFLLNLF